MLHITARKESDGRVTSGRLTTEGKVEIAYGRWEARLKVPGVLGTWPAFWTLGNDIGEISWPACGEIDIMTSSARRPTTPAREPLLDGALGKALLGHGDCATGRQLRAARPHPVPHRADGLVTGQA